MRCLVMILISFTIIACAPSIDTLTVTGPATIACGTSENYTVKAVLDENPTYPISHIVHIDEDDLWDDTLTNKVMISFPRNFQSGSKQFALECTKVGCFLAGKDDSSNLEPFYEVHAEKDNATLNVTSANLKVTCVSEEGAEQ